ncbi:MAG: ssDNA-binding domain-containing protein [Methylococcaceae bacterium]|nr:ssDNA-binding domain-containing protein [Methylococcaceae bacterium]
MSRPLKHDFEPYNGINVLNLWMEAEERGFSAPVWMTFKQAKDLGGCVRKGEKASLAIIAKTFKKTEEDENTGEEIEKNSPFMKGYSVFNVEQIDGLPDKYYELAKEPEISPEQRIEEIEQFFLNTGAEIKEGGNRAYYTITHDYIQMPPFIAFENAEAFYSTLAHETTHWTRHPSRLDRDLGRKKWGDEGYAMEELVAELGSAYIGADLGLVPDVREENAAYIANWLEVLKNDKRAIFTAAAHAQRSAELLHSYQENPQPRPAAKEELEEVAELEEHQTPQDEKPDFDKMQQLDIFEPM